MHLHDNEKIEGKKCEILIITHLSLLRKKNCGKMSLIFCLERTRSNKHCKNADINKKKKKRPEKACLQKKEQDENQNTKRREKNPEI